MTRLAERLVMLPYQRFCGKTVQGYCIEACVGVGGSGVVFRALNPQGKVVALKLLRPLRKTYDLEKVWREVEPLVRVERCGELAGSRSCAGADALAQAELSFARTAAPAAKCACAAQSLRPAIPQWLGIVREGRAYFMVLSWMSGDTLANWLFEKRWRFERAELIQIASQLLDTLTLLHEAGLAQADLRPANILYDGNRISLIDFGLSGGPQDFALDIAGFADIVIYLLYSTFEPGAYARSKAATWHDELALESSQRDLLLQLIETPQAFTIEHARTAFLTAFSAPESTPPCWQ